MTELTSHGVPAVEQLTVHQQADANTFRHGHGKDVPNVLGMPAEPELGQRAGIGGVLEHNRQADRRFDHRCEIHVVPAQVWREQQSAVSADPAWQADANPLADDARVRATHGGDGAREPSYERLRRVRCGPRRLLDEPGVDAAETDSRDLGTQLDGEDPGSLDIEVEESRAPAARRVADRAFRDPAFIDQLIDDGRYGASLQPRSPRQIGA